MNIFRLIADLLHLVSFIIIIYKIHRDKSCKGVSVKTQEVYLIVFATRYLDLFMYFVSFYNTIMKVLFLGVTLYIIYLMKLKVPIKDTYDAKTDEFKHHYLIPFALVMSLLIHTQFDWWELTWGFSLWLESVAIFPQLVLITKTNSVEAFTAHYVCSLGLYRLFYIFNWIYRYKYESYLCWTSIISGALQVLLYADFFYLYLKNIKANQESDLPIKIVDEMRN